MWFEFNGVTFLGAHLGGVGADLCQDKDFDFRDVSRIAGFKDLFSMLGIFLPV